MNDIPPDPRGAQASHVMDLLQTVSAAREGESLSTSLKAIAETAALLTNARGCGVFLADPETDELRLVASFGVDLGSDPEIGVISKKGVEWITKPQSRFLSRLDPEATSRGPPEPFRKGSYWAPMKSCGKAIGHIAVAGAGDLRLNPTAREFLRLLAIYATTLVDTARLYDTLKRHVEELRSLYDVVAALSATLDLDNVLRMIVESVARICGASACSIMLLDDPGDTMRIRAAIGVPEEIVKTAVRKLGEGIAGKVAQSGKPFFARDISTTPGVQGCNPSRYKSQSLICMPLKARGRVIGVLNVNDKRSGEFTPEDANLVTLFANQAAIAIDNARLHSQVLQSSVTDGLTQTFVSTYFKERLEHILEAVKGRNGHLAVVMVDLDHFKQVNDQYGHLVGDIVLKGVAELLRRAVRIGDLVARYGGEEFVLVLVEVPPRIVVGVCERIRRALESTTFSDGKHLLRVTASFGIAMFPEDAGDPKQLVQIADQMMYRSKGGGRNRVTCTEALIRKVAEDSPA